ncbi:desmethyl-deoxy-podophyllotoxin synthase-like [Oryza brachyantha]|uniref:Cytochrome P450 n=1 Tax=Oryza brachyantha TaxID=4533 RepID=J3MEE4_ORYBR|nr:desmethyl-deoxy-podophyllotoxin synthase-like [Oryza brachyantha]
MDSLIFFCILALLPFLYLVKSYILSSVNSTIQLPPGPWQIPIIGSLHHLRGALPHRAIRELSRRYGPVMFLKFGEVPVIVASSREAAMEVMKTHDIIFATRPVSPTMRVFNEKGQGLIFRPYGSHWRQLRKLCIVELLSARRVELFRPVREEEAARLVQSISSSVGSLVDLNEQLAAYVTDTTVRTVMGDRFMDQDAFLHILDEGVQLMAGFSLANLFPSSRLAHALCPMVRRALAHREAVHKFMIGIINEHIDRRSLEGGCDHEAIIDVLLRIHREGDLHNPLSMDTVKGVVLDLFSAGSETAATTLQWAMAELIKNPTVLSKAQAEVCAVFSGPGKVAEEGIEKLQYLHSVVDETLRLHPPVPLLVPRECQEQCRLLGYDVPKGATVIVNAWAISTDPEYWDEPEEFMPERFQGGKIDFKGNNFEFIPFGAGRRICPGMSFGIASIELALANLLFYFDWSLPEGVNCSELDMTEATGITVRRKSRLWLKATPRVPLYC